MKVRYVGSADPTDNTVCEAFGGVFNKGEWVEMEAVPPRMATNWTFEVEPKAADLSGQDEPGYAALKVKALKALAAERGLDLGDVTLKADIVRVLEAHDEMASLMASAASPADDPSATAEP